MPSKNKTKGNNAEIALGKILSASLGGSFTRVPNSGSMVGQSNSYRRATLSDTQNRIFRGDLIPPDHLSKLVIESKSYTEFRFHQLLTPGECPQLDIWVAQTKECIMDGDFWLVCFKIVRKGWFVAVSTEFTQQMAFKNHAVYFGQHGEFKVTELQEFLDLNNGEIVRLCQ